MTIWVIEEDLMPARNGPATVVRVAKAHGVAFAHETLDVVGAEAKVTMTHGIHELLHLEAGI